MGRQMKKLLTIVFSVVLVASIFAGCSSGKTSVTGNDTTSETTTDKLNEDVTDSTTDALTDSSESITTENDEDDTTESSNESESTTEDTMEDTTDDAIKETDTDRDEDTTAEDSEDGIKKLHVSGAKLVDEDGNQVQLKGISTHGIAWFPDYINNSCFSEFKSYGADIMRLAMYTAEYNGYCTGGDRNYLKNLIKNGVNYATENNMYVIIDWHILSDGNPNTYINEAKEFFKEMAQTYADYDNVFYEICNEPNGGTTWEQIKTYAYEVIKVIREYDDDGIIIVGTPNWSQYVKQAAASPIVGYDNIMYALHFYAATHTDYLRNEMESAINSGLPIFVTEYGICDASGAGGIDEYQAGEWVKMLDKYGVSYVAWNLSNKNETSAVFNSWCSKISGFEKSDFSAAGLWLLNILDDNQT